MKPFNKSFDRGSKPAWKKPTDRPNTLHDAVCSECGNRCQVPFKPNGKKPVLCNNCFTPEDRPARKPFGDRPSFSDRPPRGDRPSFRAPSVPSNHELREVNAKLDRILALLESGKPNTITKSKDETDEPKPRKKAWANIKYD